LAEAGLVAVSALKGCSREEIGQIEAKFHLQLPLIYEEFLLRMGKAAGQFLVGSDYLFPEPLRLRGDAEMLLEESGARFKFERSHFVFLGHQGYEFLFFNNDGSPDPAVLLLAEGEEPHTLFPRFSEWFRSCVTDEIEAIKSLRRAAP
jgi:hypothetical protein